MNFKEIILSFIYDMTETQTLFQKYKQGNLTYVNGRFYTGDNLNKFNGLISPQNLLDSSNKQNLKTVINNDGSLTLSGDNFYFEKTLPYPIQLINNVYLKAVITGNFSEDTFRIGLRNNQDTGQDSSLLLGGLTNFFEFSKGINKFILNQDIVTNMDYTGDVLELTILISQDIENNSYKCRYKLYTAEGDKQYAYEETLTINNLDYAPYSIVIYHIGSDANSYLTVKSLECSYNNVHGEVATTLSLDAPVWVEYDSNGFNVTATLLDETNQAVVGKDVVLNVGGSGEGTVEIIEITDSNGVAVFNVPISSKNQLTLTASFEEIDDYIGCESASKTVSVGATVTLELSDVHET